MNHVFAQLHTLTITELYRRNPLRVCAPPADLVLWCDDGFWDWSHIAPLPSGLLLETAFFYANDGRPTGVHLCYFLGEKEIRYFLELRAVRQTSRSYLYYFRCPCCNYKRPVSILYLLPGQTHFACRYCHHLAYSATAAINTRPARNRLPSPWIGGRACPELVEWVRVGVDASNKSPPWLNDLPPPLRGRVRVGGNLFCPQLPPFRNLNFAERARLRPKSPKMRHSTSIPALQRDYHLSIAATTANPAKKIKIPKFPVQPSAFSASLRFNGLQTLDLYSPLAARTHKCIDTCGEEPYTRGIMLLGMATSSYHLAAGLEEWQPVDTPPMRLEHFFRKAAELLLEGVCISDLRLLESADYGYLSSLRRSAEKLNLFTELTYKGLQSTHLQDTIRIAGALGAKQVAFYPCFERPETPELMEAGLQELSHLLSAALPVVEKYKVNLAVAGGGSLTAQELLTLLQATSHELVGVCLDPASALLVLEAPEQWVQLFGALAFSFHLSDYQIYAAEDGAAGLFCCPLGEGFLNIPDLLARMQQYSPEAHLILATPGEILPLPFLEEAFLERLYTSEVKQFARVMRTLKQCGLEKPPLLPPQSASSEDEILAIEEERFEDSLDWLRNRLAAAPPSENGGTTPQS